MTTIDLSENWSIILKQSHPTADLAGRELADYLSQIGGRAIKMADNPVPGEPVFHLQFDEGADDGFTWRVEDRNVYLNGNNQRGLLYAVYSFLEALGCCWFAPGKQGERVPQGIKFDLSQDTVTEKPAFPGRCLIIGHHAFMQDAAEWIIWAARNRLNTLFFHTTTGSLALGAVPESQYQSMKPVTLPLLTERGMTIEHGGHGLTELLPRQLFDVLPEAFRYKNGKRSPDHNFCPSSDEGLKIIQQNAEKHFRAHPEVDVFHLWGDDITGGGWCDCEKCSGYSASEQLLLAINAVADVLAKVNPAAQISFIAYHDTEAVPEKVIPGSNVHVLWAPRMRCYGHAVSDSTCRLNVPKYVQTVRDQVEYFAKHDAAPMRVFEYYLDAVLFKSVLPILPTVIRQDVLFYRDAGVHTMQALMTGDYAWTAPQLNVWLFPRMIWNPDLDLNTLITHFSQAAYGTDLLRYYLWLEKAFSLALDIVPEQLDFSEEPGPHNVWRNPPTDMGDPVFASQAILEDKIGTNWGIQTSLIAAQGELDLALDSGNPLLNKEVDHFRLLKSWLQFDFYRLCLYASVADQSKESIRECWQKANQSLNEVYQWGRSNILSDKHRRNFDLIHYLEWNVRLNKIRADYLSGKLRGHWLELVTKLHLTRLYSKMRHVYDIR